MCSLKRSSEKSSILGSDEVKASINSNKKSRCLPIVIDVTDKKIIKKTVKRPSHKNITRASPYRLSFNQHKDTNFIDEKRKDYRKNLKIPILKTVKFQNDAPTIQSSHKNRKLLKAKRKENSKSDSSLLSNTLQSKVIRNSNDEPISLSKNETTLIKKKEFWKSKHISKVISTKRGYDTLKNTVSLKASKSNTQIQKAIKPILKPVIGKLRGKKSKSIYKELKKFNNSLDGEETKNKFDLLCSSNLCVKKSSISDDKLKNSSCPTQIFASMDVDAFLENCTKVLNSESQNDSKFLSKSNGTNYTLQRDPSSHCISKSKKLCGPYQMGRPTHRSKLVTVANNKTKLINEYSLCHITKLHDKEGSKCTDRLVSHSHNLNLKSHLQDKVDQFCNFFNKDNSTNTCLLLPSMEVDSFSEICTESSKLEPLSSSKITKDFNVIIDTNILIDNQNYLCGVGGRLIAHQVILKLVIPYIVLQELDNLKNKIEEVGKKARNAINWISIVKKENPNVIGQSMEEHLEAKAIYEFEIADDAILSCCLHYKKLKKHVILLSDDINLRNKAIFSNVDACSAKEFQIFVSKLYKFESENKLCEKSDITDVYNCIIRTITGTCSTGKDKLILDVHSLKSNCASVLIDPFQSQRSKLPLQNSITDDSSEFDIHVEENIIITILGEVLKHALKDAYGDLWHKIVFCKPPWHAIDVLQCIKKHWIAIFIDKFSNEFNIINTQLINILSHKSHCAERQKICNKKLILLMTLIDKYPYKNLLKSNESLINKLHNSTQNKIQSFYSLPEEPEVINANFSDNSFQSINNELLNNNPASCFLKDAVNKESHSVIKCEGFTFTAIQNSITELGEHATYLMNGLMSKIINDTIEPDTASSLCSLRETLVVFGFTMQSYKNEFHKLSEQESLCDQISNYWKLAGGNVPHFSFKDENIFSWAHTNEGKYFFTCCISDLEKIIQTIDTALVKPASNV